MTDWTPTDEQIETAARAEFESVMVAIGSDDTWDEHADRLEQEAYLAQAHAGLTAAGPMIAAQALRDAAEWLDDTQTTEGGYPRDIPLILHGWADQIEKEASRG